MLLAVAILLGLRLRGSSTKFNLAAAPRLRRARLWRWPWRPVCLYLLAERTLNINTLSAVLCGLASYGLLGLWLARAAGAPGFRPCCWWWAFCPSARTWITLLGYPMRLMHHPNWWARGCARSGFPPSAPIPS